MVAEKKNINIGVTIAFAESCAFDIYLICMLLHAHVVWTDVCGVISRHFYCPSKRAKNMETIGFVQAKHWISMNVSASFFASNDRKKVRLNFFISRFFRFSSMNLYRDCIALTVFIQINAQLFFFLFLLSCLLIFSVFFLSRFFALSRSLCSFCHIQGAILRSFSFSNTIDSCCWLTQ